MYFVVAFSSSLDIAAIQMELGKQLDFNKELQTVGFNNFISGCTGGFTGSYIFSQTIFTMRSGVKSRAVGLMMLLVLAVAFLIPISILDYVPKFFFGSVLTFISVDLMVEWVYRSYKLVQLVEYLIILITFFSIAATSIEIGMLIGLACAALQFVVQYARQRVTVQVFRRSNVMRGFKQRSVLALMRSSIVVLKLQGYVFFGSGVNILKEVKRAVLIEDEGTVDEQLARTDSTEEAEERRDARQYLAGCTQPKCNKLKPLLEGSGFSGTRVAHVGDMATKYVLLDFKHVSGTDATSIRSLFATLAQILAIHGIHLVLTSLRPEVKDLLRAHGVLEDDEGDGGLRVFDSLDDGLEWCEDELLSSALPDPNLQDRLNLGLPCGSVGSGPLPLVSSVLRAYLTDDTLDAPLLQALHKHSAVIDAAFETTVLDSGDAVFTQGTSSDHIFLIGLGTVGLYQDLRLGDGNSAAPAPSRFPRMRKIAKALFGEQVRGIMHKRTKVLQYDQGGIIGDLDFFLQQKRSFTAEALAPCTIHSVSRSALSDMTCTTPEAASVIREVILKSAMLAINQTMLENLAKPKVA